MEWYYVEAGKQAGPVTEADLDKLVSSGRIRADTLVWREGMPNWQPVGVVRPGVAPSAAGPAAASFSPAAPPMAGAVPVGSAPAAGVVCAQCGGIFPRENTIQYGSSYVCAACKRTFVQKIKEGVPTAFESLNYAGFW